MGLGFALIAGCGDGDAGKEEFASVCAQRLGSAEKCGCYVDAIEQALSPEQFATVVQGVHNNRDSPGADWIPNSVRTDPVVSSALSDASQSCFAT
jgi:hypothetical protein